MWEKGTIFNSLRRGIVVVKERKVEGCCWGEEGERGGLLVGSETASRTHTHQECKGRVPTSRPLTKPFFSGDYLLKKRKIAEIWGASSNNEEE